MSIFAVGVKKQYTHQLENVARSIPQCLNIQKHIEKELGEEEFYI